MQDLTGQVFGQLIVLEPAPSRGNKKYWRCRCTCGTIKDIEQYSLVYGTSKSCGCTRIEKNKQRALDLTGQTFGQLTVLEPAPPRGKYKYWKCKCACGNIKDIMQSSLISGHTQSCGCIRERKSAEKNLIGQVFGRLTVIDKAPSKGGYNYWRCQCTCGNIKDVRQSSLISGVTKSCGCLWRKKAVELAEKDKGLAKGDLIGQTFGQLTVLEQAPSKNDKPYWKCQCTCGTIKDIMQHNLIYGNTKSCGCLVGRKPVGRDLIGQTFGRLTVIAPAPSQNGLTCWRCRCACGTIKDVRQDRLLQGHAKSCGCLLRETNKKEYNLVGQIFGKLTVLSQSVRENGMLYCTCKCTCGTIKDIYYIGLISGNVQSCGCISEQAVQEEDAEETVADLAGKTIGQLTVLEHIGIRNGEVYWKCKCACGIIKEISQRGLLNKTSQSCGSLQHTLRLQQLSGKVYGELVGQKFGDLLVLGKMPPIGGQAYWKCVCSCGTSKNISQKDLLSGNIKSCGHYTQVGDLVGRKFGQWTVIEQAPPKCEKQRWKCQCSCGTIKELYQTSLLSGLSKSCGCLAKNGKYNLVGQTFGQLTVLEKTQTIKGYTYWKCQCTCGTIKEVRQDRLLSGNTKSCGCLAKQSKPKQYDLTGQIFGKLTVIGEPTLKNRNTYWKCQCTCGTIKDIAQSSLLSGHAKSCGCSAHQNKYDLVGKTFGRLTVIEKAPTIKENTYWRCKCTCGTVKDIAQHSLLSGDTKSCGCLKKKYDLTGQTFGRLTVLEIGPKIKGQTFWKCRCECGTIKDIAQGNLVSGSTKSCGCARYKRKTD